MPPKGKAWGPVRRPRRLQATYNRYNGVMHMLAALDLATGKLYYHIRPRKRWREFLGLLKSPARPLARAEAVRGAGQLLPAQTRQGPRLGHRQ
jgi:hypothetical protein